MSCTAGLSTRSLWDAAYRKGLSELCPWRIFPDFDVRHAKLKEALAATLKAMAAERLARWADTDRELLIERIKPRQAAAIRMGGSVAWIETAMPVVVGAAWVVMVGMVEEAPTPAGTAAAAMMAVLVAMTVRTLTEGVVARLERGGVCSCPERRSLRGPTTGAKLCIEKMDSPATRIVS